MSTLPASALASQFQSHTFAIATSGDWLTIKRVPIKGVNGEMKYYDIRIRRKVGDQVIQVKEQDAFSRAQIYQAAKAAQELFGAMVADTISQTKVTYSELGDKGICKLTNLKSNKDEELDPSKPDFDKPITEYAEAVHRTFFTTRMATLDEADILYPKFEFFDEAAAASEREEEEEDPNCAILDYFRRAQGNSRRGSSGSTTSETEGVSHVDESASTDQPPVAETTEPQIPPPKDYLEGITWKGLKEHSISPKEDQNYKRAYQHLQDLLQDPQRYKQSEDHRKMFKWLHDQYLNRFQYNQRAQVEYEAEKAVSRNLLGRERVIFRDARSPTDDFQKWCERAAAKYVLGFLRTDFNLANLCKELIRFNPQTTQ